MTVIDDERQAKQREPMLEKGIPLSTEAGHEEQRVGIKFEFLASREWFELGNQVLVMPERADAVGAGLEGFVGIITKTL